MLVAEPFRYRITVFDRQVFALLVPPDHPLVAAEQKIDWEGFRPQLESLYSPRFGQPAIDPVIMLKIEFLRYWYNLSDRQVIQRLKTDVAMRQFLQVGATFDAPDDSLLSRFRARLGAEGTQRIFDELVAQARKLGLIKDRLRLKDASHVVASIAIPSTLALVAQIRNRLLAALEPFDAEWVAGQRVEVELLRARTEDQPDAGRLEARVTHFRELVAWAETVPSPANADVDPAVANRWQKLQTTLTLAQKILCDREQPEAKRKTLSVTDPDARRGKHGAWYEGYVVDILMDADSELLTQINVLEAGGDEAQDAVDLVRAEQAAHGNQIEALSIDGAGFNGEMLRTLEGSATNPDEPGLGVKTFVPPKAEPATERFTPDQFTPTDDGESVTCPAGQTSQYRQRDGHTTIHRFTHETCAACPLRGSCLPPKASETFGRSVTKNDYEAEYQRARARAQTAEFANVRREHPGVERKLNELLNHHGGRRARYWGRVKIRAQELMTGFAVNVKRMLRLLAPVRAVPAF
jgi:transposase